jgi:hypothetical protein
LTTHQAKKQLARPLKFGDALQIEALEILYYGTRQPDDHVITLQVELDARNLAADLERAVIKDVKRHPTKYEANAKIGATVRVKKGPTIQ